MNQLDNRITDMRNRLCKRWRHLKSWASKQHIDMFRLFDRDIPGVPFVVDALPGYWLVWVCHHSYDDATLSALTQALTDTLTLLSNGQVIIKDRGIKKQAPTDYFSKDVITTVCEAGITFELNLTRYLDVGLFIDHRLSRAMIRRESKGKRVLNLFSYTGSFSCYALKGGASFVASVDLNPVYTQWHQRHCELNHIPESRYHLFTQDVMTFLNRHSSSYDIIICDPPSFSHSKRKGAQKFHIQTHAHDLLTRCMARLKPNGWVFFSTNYRSFNMEDATAGANWSVKDLTSSMCAKDFEDKWMSRCWRVQAPDSDKLDSPN